MAKLIFDKGVVQNRTDLNPVTGCWRVVYEKLGEGARYKQTLDENEHLANRREGLVKGMVSKVFASEPEYTVYAVSKEEHLLLEFSERVQHQNQVNYFDLCFKVEYHVADPKALVEHLRAGKEDPLARLRDTVKDEISRASKKVAWENIKDEYAFSEAADELTSPQTEISRKLQGIARYLGLAITEIKLSLRLLEKDLQEWKDKTEHERILAQKGRDKQITSVNEEIKDVKAMYEIRRKTWQNAADALNTGLINIGQETNTADQMLNNVKTISAVFSPLTNTSGLAADGSSLPERAPRLLTDKTNGALGGGLSSLLQVVNLVSGLDLREKEKQHLLAAVFHLAGELLAADEEQPEALAYYRDKYQTILDTLMHELSVHQYNTLKVLLNTEQM
jgi:hypothetical protein